ncbi:MAG TPA: SGNH/GDSL hydrolase family protein [Bryobacteraceae bacterium]
MRIRLFARTAVILLSPLCAALAASVDNLVVFGDSLSDNGNAAAALASQGQTLGNYAPNALTDGPNTNPPTSGPFGLWVDQFAAKFGLPDPTPFIANTSGGLAVNPFGTNFAVGSAQTGHNPAFALSGLLNQPPVVPWTTDQVDIFNSLNQSTAAPGSLYSFWAGSDDISHALSSNPLTVVSVAQNAANNIESNIKTLAGEGGKYFLWFNLPPLGDTPAARSAGPLAMLAANQATAAFNAQMSADVTDLEHMLSNVVIITIDIHSAFEQIEGNPQAFGFANITDSAQGKNVDPNTYLFWDDLHPTTAADALIADLAAGEASRFVTATPEPASVALAFLGIIVLAAFGWGRSLSSRRCLVRPRSNE